MHLKSGRSAVDVLWNGVYRKRRPQWQKSLEMTNTVPGSPRYGDRRRP